MCTDKQTDRTTTVTLAAHARRGLIIRSVKSTPEVLLWLMHTVCCVQTKTLSKKMTVPTRGEANMLKILPIILFHSAHKLSQLFL